MKHRMKVLLLPLIMVVSLLGAVQVVRADTPMPPHHPDDFITWQHDTEGYLFYHPSTGTLDPIWDANIQFGQPWMGRYGQYKIQDSSEYVWRWEWDFPNSRGYMPWAADHSTTTFSRHDRERRLSSLIASVRHDPNPHIYSSGGVHGPSNQSGLWGPFGGELFSSKMDFYGIVSYAPYFTLGVGYSHDEAGGQVGWAANNVEAWMGTRMLMGSTADGGGRYNAVERSPIAKVVLGCGRYALARFFIANQPGDNPPVLPVVAGSDTDWNYLEQGLGGLAVSPDCGDESSPFPQSCIATHAQSYIHAASYRNTSTTFTDHHRRAIWDDAAQRFVIPASDIDSAGNPRWSWIGSLGHTVSVEIIMRKIVPGLYRSPSPGAPYEPVFPTQYAPDTDPTVTYPQYAYPWPLPAGLQEDYSKWMTSLHATEFTQSVGGEKTGTEFGYADDDAGWWASFNANPTGQTAQVWGGHWTYAGMIPMDVRSIRGRDLDTCDDGFTVFDPDTSTWVNPETIQLQAGETYTFRIQLFTGGADGSFSDRPRGSVEVWAATSLAKERSSFDLIFAESSITDIVDNTFQEYVFDYQIPGMGYFDPATNEHRIAFRVIFRARRRLASGGTQSEWPTQSGFYPYVGAVSGYEGLPTVAPIAEPLVLGRVPATGEIEDYVVPLSAPPLRYAGHIYELPRGTSVGEVPSIPLPNVPVTLELKETYPGMPGVPANWIITSTVTDGDGYYEFNMGVYEKDRDDMEVFAKITAPNSAHNLSLYRVDPGESRLPYRTPYDLDRHVPHPISPAGYEYEYFYDPADPIARNVYGSFEYNDFGYAAIVVDGGYYEVFTGVPIDSGEPVTITAETCVVNGMDLSCTPIYTDYALTDNNGEFLFNLGDWDAGWTQYMRRIRLEYPTHVYPDGVEMQHFYHELGNPSGMKATEPHAPGSEQVLFDGVWEDWLDNDVFYGAVSVDIIRRWPVVPPNPDELEPTVANTNIGEVRRQAVTTTLSYFDPGTGAWEDYPEDSEVVLEVTITPNSDDRVYYFHDSLCTDGDPSCTMLLGGGEDIPESPDWRLIADCPASLYVPSSHICVYENSALNSDVSYIGPGGVVLDEKAWPKDWAYNVFSRTPNSIYVARARWTPYWDGESLDDIWTNTVSWGVISHAAPIEED